MEKMGLRLFLTVATIGIATAVLIPTWTAPLVGNVVRQRLVQIGISAFFGVIIAAELMLLWAD